MSPCPQSSSEGLEAEERQLVREDTEPRKRCREVRESRGIQLQDVMAGTRELEKLNTRHSQVAEKLADVRPRDSTS